MTIKVDEIAYCKLQPRGFKKHILHSPVKVMAKDKDYAYFKTFDEENFKLPYKIFYTCFTKKLIKNYNYILL